jgi:hypothetical protein
MYLNHRGMSQVSAPQPSASTRLMRESIRFIWIDPRACGHSSRTHSSHGPTCLRFASGVVSAISKSSISKVRCVRDKTLKKDDQKAYPEVTPHCPLSGSIRCVRSKSVASLASGRRAGAIGLSDLARVVHTHEVIQNSIDLPFDVPCPGTWCPPMRYKTNVYNR